MVESVYTTDLKSVGLTVLRVRVSPGAWLPIGENMQTEKCINCGTDTQVPVDKPVDVRYHYVEGAGQLCEECWNKIYKK